MDRTYPCGGYDVGSIPTGSTRDTITCPAAGFVLVCWLERCFASKRNREVGSCGQTCDGKFGTPDHKIRPPVLIYVRKSSRSPMDRMPPSEGGDAGSIPAESTRREKRTASLFDVLVLAGAMFHKQMEPRGRVVRLHLRRQM